MGQGTARAEITLRGIWGHGIAMVQIKLPDGSIKEFPEAVSPRDVAAGIGKRLADVAVAAVRGRAGRRPRPAARKWRTAHRSRCGSSRPRTARHSTSYAIRRPTSWPGPSCGSFPACGSRLARPRPLASITTSRCPAIACPRTTFRRSRPRWPAFSRTPSHSSDFRLPVAEARQFVADLGQTFKVEHIDEELHKYGVLELLSPGRVCRPLPRTAYSPRRQGRCVQAAVDCGSLLEGPHRPRDAPARLRHGVLRQERAGRPASPRSRRPRSATIAGSGRELNLFTISPLVGPGLILWMPKGADRPRHPRELHQGRAGQARIPAGLHAAHRQDRALPDQRALSLLQGLAVSDPQDAGRRLGEGAARRPDLGQPGRRGPARCLLAQGRHSRTHAGTEIAEVPQPLKSFFEMSTPGADRLRRADLRDGRVSAQADELPASHPDLCGAAAELPRAAVAAGRVWHGLSLRAVGRAVGADPRARIHPGRRPSVLHPRAGARRVSLDDGDDPVLPEFLPGALRLSRAAVQERSQRPQVPRGGGRYLEAGRGRHPLGPRRDEACPTKRRPARRRFMVPRPISSCGTASAGSGSSARSSSITCCRSGSGWNISGRTISRTGR